MNVWTYSTLGLVFLLGCVVIACAIMAKGNDND